VTNEVVNNVSVEFQIDDADGNLVNAVIEYKCDELSIPWTTASIIGSITGLTQGGPHTVTWQSGIDLAGKAVTNVLLRLTPSDGYKTGSASNTFSFKVLNNSVAPVVTYISNTSGGTYSSNNVSVSFCITENNDNKVNAAIEYRSVLLGTGWQPATIIGNVTGLTQGKTNTITWDSWADMSNKIANDVELRVTPSCQLLTGTAVSSSSFTINNSIYTPVVNFVKVTNEAGPGYYADDVTVEFQVDDADGNDINVLIEYRCDELSIPWTTASIIGSITGLTQGGPHTVTWQSGTDLAGKAVTNVLLRLTPSDGYKTGSASNTTSFKVFNNSIDPVVTYITNPAVGTYSSNNVTVLFCITENNDNKVNAVIEYQSVLLGTGWQPATIIGAVTGLTQGKTNTVTWDSWADMSNKIANDVELRVTPSCQLLTGTAVSSSSFTINNSIFTPVVNYVKVTNEAGPGYYADDVTVKFQIDDADGNLVNAVIEYKCDELGIDWTNATLWEASTSLTQNKVYTFTWRSANDLPGVNVTNVELRVIPNDGYKYGTPLIITSAIEIRNIKNQYTPIVNYIKVTNETGKNYYHGDISVLFNIKDDDGDAVGCEIQYMCQTLDITWTKATIIGSLTNLTQNSNYAVVWDSAKDIKNVMVDDVKLRIYEPTDGEKIGQPKESSNFAVNNIKLDGAKDVRVKNSFQNMNDEESTEIMFNATSSAEVTISIYDMRGRIIREMKTSAFTGFNSVEWDFKNDAGDQVPSDKYVIWVKGAGVNKYIKIAVYR
jgi:hypothetical protein